MVKYGLTIYPNHLGSQQHMVQAAQLVIIAPLVDRKLAKVLPTSFYQIQEHKSVIIWVMFNPLFKMMNWLRYGLEGMTSFTGPHNLILLLPIWILISGS